MKTKKIMLLGGSNQQIVAIEKAKKMGLQTVVCDYLTDNPGQFIADKYYPVSTTDISAVYEIAQKEKIDGILAYASDPAAPTAAYIAEKMGLPTNPYESVNTLCNKDKFREYLKCNGFQTPSYHAFDNKEGVLEYLDSIDRPMLIKPVDSSGSKGVALLDHKGDVSEIIDNAFSFSRSKKVIIEQFVEKKHKYLIGGDIFVNNGDIVIWGLMNCHRDPVNPLIPVGKSYPPELDSEDLQRVKQTLNDLIHKLDIKFGPLNVELIVDRDGCVWPIDIGPRAGGNMIPDLMEMIFDADIVKMSILAAMGESVQYTEHEGIPFFATHNVHSDKDGIIERIEIDDELKEFVIRECYYVKPGDEAHTFINSSKALGIVFMRFSQEEQMDLLLNGIKEHIRVVLR